ncbi:integrin alpha-X isoform X6 [Taeniopygia guttata]|uniref:integrin alpha-X isoform X6 n=1 Tax=Taeniopygia guttata TaxID=59729 RepID=UPI003BB9711D
MEPRELLVVLGTALLTAALDLESPEVFPGGSGSGFGVSVAGVGGGDRSWLLVGAPHVGSGSGAVFSCAFGTGTCRKLPVTGPPGVNQSRLGLAMAAGDDAALVCGPIAPQVCGVNVHLNGFCVQLDTELRPVRSFPETIPECPKTALDIAILMDGSGSIADHDFRTMKTFIAEVMRRFRDVDAQFSLTQFSHAVKHHFDFSDFRKVPDPARLLRTVRQLNGATYTATAIQRVLQEMFVSGRGARAGARRVLVVVTDGEKFDDPLDYSEVIPLAEAMAVTRYAIGVGSAFGRPQAHLELQVIASGPTHVFRVDNFEALSGIQRELRERIFAIEGTSSAHSSSFQMEMAQEGFSATLTTAGPVLGAVGAFDWSGGAFAYGGGAPTFLNGSGAHLGTPGAHLGTPGEHLGTPGAPLGTPGEHLGTPGGHLGTPGEHLGDAVDARDGYLGYAVAQVPLGHTWALALGAPRFAHLGRVLLLRPGNTWEHLGEATGTQVGSYFGASLLGLGPCPGEPRPRPGELQVRLLVGAPMFYGGGSGGRVYLCEMDGQVAVGAPLEDDGHGAVYLFRGAPGGHLGEVVQRISGSRFPSQPQFFGQSLSGGRDLSGDHLPDLAVGARDQVLLLRSPPLLQVRLSVTFAPQVIPARECPEGAELREPLGVAQVCFNLSKASPDTFGSALSARLWFRARLDPDRVRPRADFGAETAENGTLVMGLGRSCRDLRLFHRGCPQDTMTPLTLRVTFGGRGDPLGGSGGLRPQIGPGSDAQLSATLPFEHDCGTDNVCQDQLQVQLNFSGPGALVVGEGDALELRLRLRNAGESSFGPGLLLRHPAPLSFRRLQLLQSPQSRSGSLRCHSEPPSGRDRHTRCHLQPPLLRGGGQVSFQLTLDVPSDAELGDSLEVTAQTTSDNGGSGGRSQSVTITVPVRYQVFLVLASSPDSTRYLNITKGGAHPPTAPVTHHYQVKVLGHRGVSAAVSFLVPSHLSPEPLWEHLEVSPEQEEPRCEERPEQRGTGAAPERHLLACPSSPCRLFRCSLPPLRPPRLWGFRVGGRLKMAALGQLALPKLHLQSSAQVSFDHARYRNTWGGTELQVQTELELLDPPNPLPLILGASLGGLLLLGLVALGLYKVGFFKRRYKEMLEGAETPGDPPGDPQS